MITLSLASEVVSPPTGPTSSLIYLIAAALGGGVIAQLISLTLRRQQRDTLIADASGKAVDAARDMLEEYRRDLIEARKEINVLRERVARLEQQIADAKEDRERLVRELADAIERRVQAQQHVDALEERIALLEGGARSSTDRTDVLPQEHDRHPED